MTALPSTQTAPLGTRAHRTESVSPLVDLLWERACQARGAPFQFLFNEIVQRDLGQGCALLAHINDEQLLSLTPSDLAPLETSSDRVIVQIGEACSHRLMHQLGWSWVDSPEPPPPSFGESETFNEFLKDMFDKHPGLATKIFHLSNKQERVTLKPPVLLKLLDTSSPFIRKQALRLLGDYRQEE